MLTRESEIALSIDHSKRHEFDFDFLRLEANKFAFLPLPLEFAV